VSGQLGLCPLTGELVEGGVAAQAEQSLKNIGAVLEAAGASFGDGGIFFIVNKVFLLLIIYKFERFFDYFLTKLLTKYS
jgi:hypothetical protein